MEEQVKCPKCGSSQITANKKGFSVGKAAAGVVLTGGIGLVAGAIGSGAVKITCLSCGNSWNPKDLYKKNQHLRQLENAGSIEKYAKERAIWDKSWRDEYNLGNFDKASEIYNTKFPFNSRKPDIHSALRLEAEEKKANKKFIAIFFTIIIILISLFIWWLTT